jgi:hypothetical protein
MFVFMRKAWQLLKHYRGSPVFGFVAFIAIPYVIYPFWALLIFGAYRAEFPQFLAAAGLLKMLDTIRLRELADSALVSKITETDTSILNSTGSRFSQSAPRPSAGS